MWSKENKDKISWRPPFVLICEAAESWNDIYALDKVEAVQDLMVLAKYGPHGHVPPLNHKDLENFTTERKLRGSAVVRSV